MTPTSFISHGSRLIEEMGERMMELAQRQVEELRRWLMELESALNIRSARLALMALERLRAEAYRLYVILRQDEEVVG